MILGFTQVIKNKPTHFVHKIWQSLLTDDVECGLLDFSDKLEKSLPIVGKMKVGDFPQKRHTIRKDSKNRWKAGNDIHFSIGVRTKNQFQFAPVVKCVSTQKIEIKYYKDKPKAFPSYGFTVGKKFVRVFIDDSFISKGKIIKLAINDGFDTIEDFFEWFDKDFEGKIIHWTDLKY